MLTMKDEAKRLWDICFNDDQDFTDLYFRERYSDKVTIGINKDDKMVSVMQLLPYPMTFHGQSINTNYISGACTDPDYRGKGYMNELIVKAMKRMKEQGVWLTTLIPASDSLFDFYERTNFVTAFDYNEEEMSPNQLPVKQEVHISPYSKGQTDVYPYFNRKMSERNCCLQHSPEDFRVIMKDIELYHDTLWVARLDGEVVGLAFCYEDDTKLLVKEVFAEFPFVEESLIGAASNKMNAEKITVTSPPCKYTKNESMGMARIVSAEPLIKIYAQSHPFLQTSFKVTDEWMKDNEGYYALSNGSVQKEVKGEAPIVTIEQLTQALLGYHPENLPEPLSKFEACNPYMSLMLE